MSYRCGIGPGIPGMEPGPPRIMCDACGFVMEIKFPRGMAPRWLLDRRAAPKWVCYPKAEGTRVDYCPSCSSLEVAYQQRDNARAHARVIAHAYVNDSAPPAEAVRESLAFPAVPPRLR